jgi:hypothetical protein
LSVFLVILGIFSRYFTKNIAHIFAYKGLVLLFNNTSLKLALKLIIEKILLTSPLNYGPGNDVFSCTSSRKVKFRLFLIQTAQIVQGCHVFTEKCQKFERKVFQYKNILRPFLYVFQNVCPQFFGISGFVIYRFIREYKWQPKTIWTRWIEKSLNFLFLEDVLEKNHFLGRNLVVKLEEKIQKNDQF